jgi:hypothetical protein
MAIKADIDSIAKGFCELACTSPSDAHWLFVKDGSVSITMCVYTSFEANTSYYFQKLDIPDKEIKSKLEQKIIEIMNSKKAKYEIDKTSDTAEISGAYLVLKT